MQTRDGGDAATLRHRSQTSTSVTLFVEEEASRDSELAHTAEVAGVPAIESGVLVAGSPLQPATSAKVQLGQTVDIADAGLADELDLLLSPAMRYGIWPSRSVEPLFFSSTTLLRC